MLPGGLWPSQSRGAPSAERQRPHGLTNSEFRQCTEPVNTSTHSDGSTESCASSTEETMPGFPQCRVVGGQLDKIDEKMDIMIHETATNGARLASVDRRLDQLNGKVADQERRIADLRIKQARTDDATKASMEERGSLDARLDFLERLADRIKTGWWLLVAACTIGPVFGPWLMSILWNTVRSIPK
jgi:hypothetical protein